MKQLGHCELPARTFEYDLAVQERIQSFSTEILRLSLLGIGAIGFIAINTILKSEDPVSVQSWIRIAVVIALVSFGISSVAALLHRYCMVDFLSWQLQSLRRDVRMKEITNQNDIDNEKAQAAKERVIRFRRYIYSRYSIVLSAVFLGVGGVSLAIGFAGVVWGIST